VHGALPRGRSAHHETSVTTEPAATDQKPFYRNPFLIAFVIGVATLTFLRPLMRSIPEPPPETGPLPIDGWTDRDGEAYEPSALVQVTLVGFVETGSSDCGSNTLLSKLWHMYREEGFDADVLVVSISAADSKELRRREAWWSGPRERWAIAGPTDPASATVLRESLHGSIAEWLPVRETIRRPRRPASLEPWPDCEGDELLAWVTLVDSSGQTRGFYNVSDWEVESELFHRTHRLLFE
jgi:hypothetical protein